MANIFALILAIATLITGISWCLERFKLASARHRRLSHKSNQQCSVILRENRQVQAGNNITKKIFYKPSQVEICSSIFPVLLLVFLVRSFIFEPFQIPSASMMPTLLIGDFILVEKFAYGIKDPITQTTFIKTSRPKRGDVVVFKYPPDPSLDYIKRVVGLPGDQVSYDSINKRVMVQPSCSSEQTCTKTLYITYSEVIQNDSTQICNLTSNGKASSDFLQLEQESKVDGSTRLSMYKESLDGVVHNILTFPKRQDQLGIYYKQPGKSLTKWVVPQGEYFVMGDNRDNSSDSRYWGFVPEKNLVGKATVIWMSFDKKEGEWPTGVRLSRIGSIIH